MGSRAAVMAPVRASTITHAKMPSRQLHSSSLSPSFWYRCPICRPVRQAAQHWTREHVVRESMITQGYKTVQAFAQLTGSGFWYRCLVCRAVHKHEQPFLQGLSARS